jgi:Ca2+-binding EF-hand superfamily protein
MKICAAADIDQSGVLSMDQLQIILQSLNIELSQFQLDVLISELDTNEDGIIYIYTLYNY